MNATTNDARWRSLFGDRAFVIDELLDEEECAEIMERAEEEGYEVADVYTDQGPGVVHALRGNLRAIFEDDALAERLARRLERHCPPGSYGDPPCGCNPLMRIQYYREDERFALHQDAPWHDVDASSYLTVLIYLTGPCEGGQTRVYLDEETWVDVEPEEGRALLFEHDLWHEGRVVEAGEKIVLRTDLMYPVR